MVSANVGLSCRITGILGLGFTYCSGYAKEEMATVDKMSTVVI